MNQEERNEYFNLLKQFLTSNGVDFSQHMKPIFEEHLSQLITCFENFFRNDSMSRYLYSECIDATLISINNT